MKTEIVSCHTCQTSQTGGQCYSDTSPFSIPCLDQAESFLSYNISSYSTPTSVATIQFSFFLTQRKVKSLFKLDVFVCLG
jgi:hypothetical protein